MQPREGSTGPTKTSWLSDYPFGNYLAGTKLYHDKSKDHFEQLVEKALGSEGAAVLHKGANRNVPDDARKAFAVHLKNILEGRTPTVPLSKKTSDKLGADAIGIEEFLGKEGVKLYQDAMQEEMNSYSFRDAVFVDSMKFIEGPRLETPMVIGVAGPSACGKSFAADNIVNHLLARLPVKSEDNSEGNYIVAIDGGIERKISQVRQIALLTSRLMGYPGLNGIDKAQKMGVKGIIYKAAHAAGTVSMVIPETHSTDLLKASIFDNSAKNYPDKTHVFGMVVPGSGLDKEEWRPIVGRMGRERSWAAEYGTSEEVIEKVIGDARPNNQNLGFESKAPQPQFFDVGYDGSLKARDKYLATSKDKIYIEATNDLFYKGDVKITARHYKQFIDESEKERRQDLERQRLPPKILKTMLEEKVQLPPEELERRLKIWHDKKMADKGLLPLEPLINLDATRSPYLLVKKDFDNRLDKLKNGVEQIVGATLGNASPLESRSRSGSGNSTSLLSKLASRTTSMIRRNSGVFSRSSEGDTSLLDDGVAQRSNMVAKLSVFVDAIKKSRLGRAEKLDLLQGVQEQAQILCADHPKLMEAAMKIMSLSAGSTVSSSARSRTSTESSSHDLAPKPLGYTAGRLSDEIEASEASGTRDIEQAKRWYEILKTVEGSMDDKMDAANNLLLYVRSFPDNKAAGLLPLINVLIGNIQKSEQAQEATKTPATSPAISTTAMLAKQMATTRPRSSAKPPMLERPAAVEKSSATREPVRMQVTPDEHKGEEIKSGVVEPARPGLRK
jgi:hypothetical protein